ncbi:hypothetical protein [Methanolacinia paynteri]|uniref:hypothetical protein n=1 Tax=Methanolacinia paynteri TaxID=230356 RepID=UPI00064F9C98|nr:hypothetical protein [Methanolacinia paynteri]
MVSMNDSTRRLIMMLTIIFAGTAVTFLELSPILVFLISIIIGVVMLFGLNILSFEELKEDILSFKERLNQPISLKKSKTDKKTGDLKSSPKKKKETDTKSNKDKKKREIPFSGLIEKLPFKKEKKEKSEGTPDKKSPFSGLFSKIKSKDGKDDKTKKIDELLDKTINEPVVGPGKTEDSAVAAAEVGEDDFSDFDDLDLGLEDEDSDFGLGDGGEIPEPESKSASAAAGMEEDIPDSAIAEILAKEGIEFDLESDDEFPELSGDEDSAEPDKESGRKGLSDFDELDSDVSGLDLEDEEMDEFDQIDLDEIEPEEDLDFEEEEDSIEIGDSEEETQEVVVAPPEESDDLFAAPPKEWSQTKQGAGSEELPVDEPLSLSFGSGGGGLDDDDLFAMLKADTKKAVVVQELSLVRDLKDTNVDSTELVDELQSVLYGLGVKVEKIDGEGNSKPEHINEDESGV